LRIGAIAFPTLFAPIANEKKHPIRIRTKLEGLKENLKKNFAATYEITRHKIADRIHEIKRNVRVSEKRALKNSPTPIIAPTLISLVDKETFTRVAKRMQRNVDRRIAVLILRSIGLNVMSLLSL
jgi:hypothetical protein